MNWAPTIDQFGGCCVLVVGDICLGRWCFHDPMTRKTSRETGISRIGVVSAGVTPRLGGAVASNLVALGAGHVAVLGAIGQDGFGFQLKQSYRHSGPFREPRLTHHHYEEGHGHC